MRAWGSSGPSSPDPALTIASGPPQGRQSNAGGVEPAVDGQDVSGDVTRALAAEKEDGFRQFLLQPVAIERDCIMIVGADLRRMHGLRHCGIDRTGSYAVDADPERGEFHREL